MRGLHELGPAQVLRMLVRDCPNPFSIPAAEHWNHGECMFFLAGQPSTGTTDTRGNVWYCECESCDSDTPILEHLWYERPEDYVPDDLGQYDRYWCPQCKEGNHPE